MRDTGEAFTVARRLVVSLDALRAWERRQQARERGEWQTTVVSNMTPVPCRRQASPMGDSEAPRWWAAA